MGLQNASEFYIWSLTEGCFNTILKIALLFETDICGLLTLSQDTPYCTRKGGDTSMLSIGAVLL